MIVSDALKAQVGILIFDITCFDDIQNKIKELQEPLKRNFGKFRVHLPLPGSLSIQKGWLSVPVLKKLLLGPVNRCLIAQIFLK